MLGEPWEPRPSLESSKVQWPVFRVGEARRGQGGHLTELCSSAGTGCSGLGASGRDSLPCLRARLEEETLSLHSQACQG